MQELIEPINLRELFALRYQVYCVERSFLSPNEYPDGEESDAFDSSAVHFAAIDGAKRILGSVRLVINLPGIGLPYQGYCRNLFLGANELPTDNVAEISRLVVSKKLSRRLEDRDVDFIDTTATVKLSFGRSERRRSSHCETIVLSLYKAMYQYSLERRITHWYATMERSLVRLLARYGVNFPAIGPITDYLGPVIPHCIGVTDLQKSVGQFNKPLLAWFNNQELDFDSGVRVVRLAAPSQYVGIHCGENRN
jgi:N-acyl amino acid synthase of PEP-CTERM/exosortase system